ncbi:isoamyl acetate-hydrolyzing esterase 1 homolog isoform X1 [Patella vulgata]|uniref:isoamyl acetate-hydrolyzing esterase 1 homolog isoform X1 n=1 Tax=Patella vulgata TaxID=6465 RepID=UPI00217F2926|nr:isoamyl acetate-hydrolyzing esterase 1 homolog isoform X1 [Patella vulgata]
MLVYFCRYIKPSGPVVFYFNRLNMSTTNSHPKWPAFVLFGDSITQFSFSEEGCWGALLTDHLQRKCDVLNRGFSGYNSRWCKIMLPKIITADTAKNVAGVTLFLGANDSNAGDTNPRQHVPLNEFKQNMADMVEYLQSIGIEREKIIMISPPAYNNDAWQLECVKKGKPCSKTTENTQKYATSCVQLCKETGIWSVDLYSEMLKNENWKEMLNDGLHLSTIGSRLLFKLLQPIVDKLTSDLPMNYPLWDEVDYENPNSSLE